MFSRLPARFWDRVDSSGGEDACWPWLRSLVHGYGQFFYQGANHTVHRLIYVSVHGEGSADGRRIGHSCSMDHCCNPAHIVKIERKRPRPGIRRRGRPRVSALRLRPDHAERLERIAESSGLTVEQAIDAMLEEKGA